MPQEEKDECFEKYLRRYQPTFIREFDERSETTNPMREEEMADRIVRFEQDFLHKARGMIKDGTWRGGGNYLDDDKLESVLRDLQEERDEEEVIGGWKMALGLEDRSDGQPFAGSASKDKELPHDHQIQSAIAQHHEHNSHGKEKSNFTSISKESCGQGQLSPRLLVELPVEISQYQGCSPTSGREGRSSPAELPLSMPPEGSNMLEGRDFMTNFSFPLHLSKSFAMAEDDLTARGHHRSSTVPDASYTTDAIDTSDSPRPAKSFHGRATGSRRQGVHVPRIFTGSFSELETEIRNMQLHKVKTPEDQPDLTHAEDLIVRDFAVTPSPTPSPATLLFRREALLSKDTELQHRIINGEVVRTRRPSTKTRAQTVDETTGGLEAWLAKDEGRADSPTLSVPPLSRPERKNTI